MLKRTGKSSCRNVKEILIGRSGHGHGHERKQEDMVYMDMLKACTKEKDICEGTKIHALIRNKGFFKKNPYVACCLINMYVQCGAFDKAKDVVEKLPIQNVVAWNALISGYAKQGKGEEALKCFQYMQHHGISPDVVTFLCILKACVSLSDVDKGKEIHDEIVRKGLLEKHIELGNALVDMYAKCGGLGKAWEVLIELRVRNVVTWSTLIAGYTQQGMGEEALKCFGLMRDESISPDAITFSSILKACGITRSLDKGIEIHDHIVDNGILQDNIVLNTALVDMYAKCGALQKAQKVFDGLSARSVVLWNALITGYTHLELCEDALNCFHRMQSDGLSPDMVTFPTILKACGCSRALNKAKQIHVEITGKLLMVTDIAIGTALVDTYAKCGALNKAQQLLDGLPVRNVICWNALITGYVHRWQGEEALNCFERMQREGISPNATTFSCILKGCCSIGAFDKGKLIHNEVVAKGCYLGSNVMLATALMDLYVKCGAMARAQQVLDELPVRDVVAWNALIAGYAQDGHSEYALNSFQRMQRESLSPDAITFSSTLKACGTSGEIGKGKQIHVEILRRGLLLEKNNLALGNALVDMYAKCGLLEKAQQVVDELLFRDIVSWSTLMSGYAFNGQCEKVLTCYEKMQQDGIRPNAITFLSVLSACNHEGLVNEGQNYFASMSKMYGIIPGPEHHACMVDLFGRAGHFNLAMDVIRKMPSSDYSPVWSALLCACRIWGNVKLGKFAFRKAVQLDSNDVAAYVCMANLYAMDGTQEDAQKIEAMRENTGESQKI